MKILFTPMTSSSIAHMIRSFAIADRLIKDGHKVIFTSCTDKYDFIKNNGYEVVKTYTPFNLNDEKDQSFNYMTEHKKELLEWFKCDIDTAIENKVDLIITSPGFFGPHVTYMTGIPTLALMNGQYTISSKGLMGISLATNSIKNIILRFILRPIFEKKFIKIYLKEIFNIYDQLGIVSSIKTREDLYDKMDILIVGDDIFEPQCKIKNTKATHVGTPFWDGFEEMETDITESFLTKFKGDKKLIFINLGGSVFDKKLYNKIVRIAEKMPHQVLMVLGPNFKRIEFPKDTDSLLIRSFVPGLLVSKMADGVVNTGSQGALMQALSSGTPVVAFPIGIDQAYFANRLEELKLGININKVNILKFSNRESYHFKELSIMKNLNKSIKTILNNKCYLQNAQQFAKESNKRHPNPVDEIVKYIYNKYDKND